VEGRGGADPLEEGRHRSDAALVLLVGFGLAFRLSFTLGLGLAFGRGPLFTLRLTSRLFRTDVAVLLHVIMRLVVSIRPVYVIRARLIGVIRTSHVPIFRRPVAIHVIWRIHVSVFWPVRIWINRGILVRVVPIFWPVTIHVVWRIYVPVFRRSHISIFWTIRVHSARPVLVAIVRPIEIAVIGAVLVRVAGARGRLVRARISGWHRSGSEVAGLYGGGHRRTAVILGGTQCIIADGSLLLLRLAAGPPKMAFVFLGKLRRIGTRRNAAAPAIEAKALIVIVADHSSIHVGIVNYDGIDPGDRGVVLEPIVIPPSADVAIAIIAVPVIDAAIETNDGRPVAVVPYVVIAVVVPAPISGGPEKAGLRRKDPGAGHPVVAHVLTV